MRASASWAIDSGAIRARGIIVFVKSKNQKVKNIENKKKKLVKARINPFCRQKAGAFRYYWAITYSLVVAQPIITQL